MVKFFKTIRLKFSRFRLFLSDFKPIMLSHHPNCDKFSAHVYHLGKRHLCIGCFTFYPVIIITIILTLLFVERNLYNSTIMYLISFIFFIPIILSVAGLTKYRFLKIFSKASNGIGVGLHLVSVFLLPFPLIVKILTLLEINFLIGAIAYIRANRIKKDCSECDYQANWDDCPG
ncbi:MAG: hypothetical protein ACTSQR_05920, partial [Promethearchaeota archaeon]